MELRQLDLFVGVAEELHFGRAAERLYIAQSALSQHVRRLERELGVDLLDRGNRHIRLTPAGAAFYDEALRILGRAERAKEAARSAAVGVTATVELGFVSTTPPNVLRNLVRNMKRSGGTVEVRSRELSALRIERDLADGLLDAAVVDGLHRDDVESLTLDDEPLVAVCSEGMDVGPGAIALIDLRDRPFAVPRMAWAPGLATTILGACHDAGFHPNVVAEVDSPSGWMLTVAAGLAVTLSPASIATRWEGNAVVAPLAGVAPRSVTTLVWRAGAAPHVDVLARRAVPIRPVSDRESLAA